MGVHVTAVVDVNSETFLLQLTHHLNLLLDQSGSNGPHAEVNLCVLWLLRLIRLLGFRFNSDDLFGDL